MAAPSARVAMARTSSASLPPPEAGSVSEGRLRIAARGTARVAAATPRPPCALWERRLSRAAWGERPARRARRARNAFLNPRSAEPARLSRTLVQTAARGTALVAARRRGAAAGVGAVASAESAGRRVRTASFRAWCATQPRVRACRRVRWTTAMGAAQKGTNVLPARPAWLAGWRARSARTAHNRA